MARCVGGVEPLQSVEGGQSRSWIVEGEDLPEDTRTFEGRQTLASQASLLFNISGKIIRAEGADRLLRDDQRRIPEKGKVVQLTTYGSLFDTQSAATITLVVAPSTLERSVEKGYQQFS